MWLYVLTWLSLLFAVLLGYHVYSIQFSTRKLPPGPLMAPFGVGNLPAIIYEDPKLLLNITGFRPWEYFDRMAKVFGDIFSIQVGSFYLVVLASYEILQEVAGMEEYSVKLAHEHLTHPRTFNKELGLVFVGKPELWVEMRKFTQRTLRDFGFGKRLTMQSAIEAETTLLVKMFENVIKNEGGVIKIRTTFVLSVLNVLWCMVAGERYEYDDPILKDMMETNVNALKSTTFAEPLHALSYVFKRVFPSLFKEDLRQRAYNDCNNFTKGLIDKRKCEGMYKSSPQNYIDVFLQKIYSKDTSDNGIYTEEQLQAMLADLIQAGFTTTNATINYALLYLILHPEMQQRCQQEIDAVVSPNLTPTMEDIEKMPFFRAFVLETHRLANVAPNPVPRVAPTDWNLRGYKIPKGALIFSNHYSVHMNDKYWADPHHFRPQRFLNADGQFVPDKRVVHFGFGKRYCIGVTLANSVIPIFLATFLQHFTFSVVPGTKPPTTEPEIGVSLSPLEYSVLVIRR